VIKLISRLGRRSAGCSWCDGWEHKDKPFANLGPFSAAFVSSTIAGKTLNPQSLVLTNGTMDDVAKVKASKDLPDWGERLELYNITIENRIITRFSRLHGDDSDYKDDFVITFQDNSTVILNAIKGTFPAKLSSDLPVQIGLKLTEDKDAKVKVDEHMESSVPGISMVGDANS